MADTQKADPPRRGLFRRWPPDVDRTRAWSGFWVVSVGDTAIVIAAILGIVHLGGGGANGSSIVAILSAAFTAVGTTTTAYFGIRAASNTAQTSINKDGTTPKS